MPQALSLSEGLAALIRHRPPRQSRKNKIWSQSQGALLDPPKKSANKFWPRQIPGAILLNPFPLSHPQNFFLASPRSHSYLFPPPRPTHQRTLPSQDPSFHSLTSSPSCGTASESGCTICISFPPVFLTRRFLFTEQRRHLFLSQRIIFLSQQNHFFLAPTSTNSLCRLSALLLINRSSQCSIH